MTDLDGMLEITEDMSLCEQNPPPRILGPLSWSVQNTLEC